nr:hypothetical protein [Tanacetum cinerariifolium]
PPPSSTHLNTTTIHPPTIATTFTSTKGAYGFSAAPKRVRFGSSHHHRMRLGGSHHQGLRGRLVLGLTPLGCVGFNGSTQDLGMLGSSQQIRVRWVDFHNARGAFGFTAPKGACGCS